MRKRTIKIAATALGNHGGETDGEDILAIALHPKAADEEEVERDVENAAGQ
jgi:hypothetical protein